MRRSPLRRLRDWWDRRRRLRALVPFFGGPDAEGGAGVREPRRPKRPSLSGAVALKEPDDDT